MRADAGRDSGVRGGWSLLLDEVMESGGRLRHRALGRACVGTYTWCRGLCGEGTTGKCFPVLPRACTISPLTLAEEYRYHANVPHAWCCKVLGFCTWSEHYSGP